MVSDDTVVPIRKGRHIPNLQKPPDQNLVEELEGLLQLARNGQIVGVAYATHWHDGANGNRFVGVCSRSMVGAMFSVMTRITKQIDET